MRHYPRWTYTVHTQAGIWKRASLLMLLSQLGGARIESFEITGSDIANQAKPGAIHPGFRDFGPQAESLHLDSCSKCDWVVPYHNLIHRGTPNPRWNEFLAAHGLQLSLTPDPQT
jgi:hypothetical protein